jgi:hypothetical protein
MIKIFPAIQGTRTFSRLIIPVHTPFYSRSIIILHPHFCICLQMNVYSEVENLNGQLVLFHPLYSDSLFYTWFNGFILL